MTPDPFRFIVLHSFKYKESGLIVKGYSSLTGIDTLFMRGAGKKNSRHSTSLLHPLSILNIVTSSRTFGEMKTIKEFEPAHKLRSVRGEIGKISIALFISELVSATLREKEKDTGMFSFLEKSILELEDMQSGTANFHLLFVIRLIDMLGYMPEIPQDTSGLLFDIPSAGYMSDNKRESHLEPHSAKATQFTEERSNLLKELSHISPQQLGSLKIPRKSRVEFIESMLRYLSYHAGYHIECESLRILHEVFE
jgi:DNA repair protein RecO (recombination protein O)